MEHYGLYFWGFLAIYGIVMYLLSPRAQTVGSFFNGESALGKSISMPLLTSSIFISWIFAKSITNAANLGAKYGIVGGIAYATYWLCIPIAGLAIYRLRTKFGARGLVEFLTTHYGQWAAFAFSAAILIRLFNEVWSNTAVVGGYYGASGSQGFIIAALLFTLITLLYSLRGGLRGSIMTDVAQALIFILLLAWVMGDILPQNTLPTLLGTGDWRLEAGVDLLLVAALQLFSYPFHDPVLTDRGFICEEKTMLRAFVISGILGFIAIVLFSFVGIHAKLIGLTASGNVPAALAGSMGAGALLVMTIVMVIAAGSTLDSTFSSLSKLVGRDLAELLGKNLGTKAIGVGMIAMVIFAIFGNIPMFLGTDILKATTISGTMVIGLAPVFMLHGWIRPTPLGFHLSFWLGIALGIWLVLGGLPEFLKIGEGDSAMLLGVNFYGLILCVIAYWLPSLWKNR
ncbi:MAG: sodium:solute symporter [Wolinella sp.]